MSTKPPKDTSKKAKKPKKVQPAKPPVSVGKTISRLLYRFHFVLFVVLVLGGIAVVIFLINQTLSSASDTSHHMPTGSAMFDEATIEQLRQLDDSTGRNSELAFPPGRINPFAE